MRVLGIDPGSLKTGYGIVDKTANEIKLVACGCIINKTKDPFDRRYYKIFSELKKIIYELKPDIAALENVIYCNNSKVAIKLGESRGIAILSAAESNIPIAEYSPKSIKQATVGNGNASKYQIQTMIKQIFNLATVPQPDTADALAVAICHINNKMYNLKIT